MDQPRDPNHGLVLWLCAPRRRSYPGAYNVTQAWTSQVKGNWSTKHVAFIGDSTFRGTYAGTDGTGLVDYFGHSISHQFMLLQRARGFAADDDCWYGIGESGYTAFPVGNAKLSVGSGWASTNNPNTTVGGYLLHNSADATPLVFTPEKTVDTFWIFYRRSTSSLSLQIDAEGAETYNGATYVSGASASLQRKVKASTVGVGARVLTLARISGDPQPLGMEAFDSTSPRKRILNLSWAGATAGNLADVSQDLSSLNAIKTILALRTAPLVMINAGINDEASQTVSQYTTNMQSIITGVVAAGGIPLLVAHHPTNAYPTATFIEARRSLARSNGIPLYDLREVIPSWSYATARSWNFDGTAHLNATGQGIEAAALDNFLAWVVR